MYSRGGGGSIYRASAADPSYHYISPSNSSSSYYQQYQPPPYYQQQQQQPHPLYGISPPPNRSGYGSAMTSPTLPSHPSIFRAGGGGAGGNNSSNNNINSNANVGNGYDGSGDYGARPMYDTPPPPNTASTALYPRQNEGNHQIERNMLLMQQEAEFGINMYDSLTPADEPEINSFLSQGYSYDEAVKMIFDRRYLPYTATATATATATTVSNNGYYEPQEERRGPGHRRQLSRGGGSQYGSSNNINGNGNVQPGEDLPYGNNSQNGRSLRRPPSQMAIGGSGGSVSSSKSRQKRYRLSDVKQLEKMGFTKEQAIQALMENDNDLHRAADVLLSMR